MCMSVHGCLQFVGAHVYSVNDVCVCSRTCL